jgi:hypothetical protein
VARGQDADAVRPVPGLRRRLGPVAQAGLTPEYSDVRCPPEKGRAVTTFCVREGSPRDEAHRLLPEMPLQRRRPRPGRAERGPRAGRPARGRRRRGGDPLRLLPLRLIRRVGRGGR